jgi:hypothetical protein
MEFLTVFLLGPISVIQSYCGGWGAYSWVYNCLFLPSLPKIGVATKTLEKIQELPTLSYIFSNCRSISEPSLCA